MSTEHVHRNEKISKARNGTYYGSRLTNKRGYAASNERGSAEVKYQWKGCVWEVYLRNKRNVNTNNAKAMPW